MVEKKGKTIIAEKRKASFHPFVSNIIMPAKALFVLTSNDALGETGQKTGWYLPEAAHPHHVLTSAGVTVEWASIKGGEAPVDEGSLDMSDATNKAFWEGQGKAMTSTTKVLAECSPADYDVVLFVGGFGTMWDFPDNESVQRFAKEVYENGGIAAAVCHGPCALVNVKLSSGEYLVAGQEVAAFTNDEEDAVQRREIVPFTCEDKLKERGATHVDGGVFKPQVCVARGGRLITGQNPPSATPFGEAIVASLKNQGKL